MKKPSIEEVKAEFRRWQKSRKGKRSRTPVQLREMALGLREDYADERICGALGIYRSYLQRWKKGRKVRSRKPVMPMRPKSRAQADQKAGFVEITGSLEATAPRASRPASVALEWIRGDGARMQMSGALDTSQIERLAECFLASRVGR